ERVARVDDCLGVAEELLEQGGSLLQSLGLQSRDNARADRGGIAQQLSKTAARHGERTGAHVTAVRRAEVHAADDRSERMAEEVDAGWIDVAARIHPEAQVRQR